MQDLMILGYRAFAELMVGPLSRVNLFVGANNSGKTSVLEAVNLLATGGDPFALYQVASRRAEMLPMEDERGTPERRLDVSHLFHGHDIQFGQSFQIEGMIRPVSVNSTLPEPEHLSVNVVASSDESGSGDLFSESPTVEAVPGERLALQMQSSRLPELRIPLSLQGGLTSNAIREAAARETERRVRRYDRPVLFVSTDSLEMYPMARLWDSIALTTSEEEVIRSLRSLEPAIERIAYLGTDSARYSRAGGFFLKMRGDDRRLPLGSLGDGVRRLLALCLSVVRAEHGVLLVDEIDTGFHYSVLAEVWRMIIEAAHRLDVHVYATTHSSDCIRGLASTAEELPHLASEVALHRIERGSSKTIPYDARELMVAYRHHMEVR